MLSNAENKLFKVHLSAFKLQLATSVLYGGDTMNAYHMLTCYCCKSMTANKSEDILPLTSHSPEDGRLCACPCNSSSISYMPTIPDFPVYYCSATGILEFIQNILKKLISFFPLFGGFVMYVHMKHAGSVLSVLYRLPLVLCCTHFTPMLNTSFGEVGSSSQPQICIPIM